MTDVYRQDTRHSRAPLDETRCKASVHGRDRWFSYSQCARKPVNDGWCKQHHPDAEKARAETASANHRREMRRHAMGWLGEGFMSALIAIRDGANDPRQVAADALKGCAYTNEEANP